MLRSELGSPALAALGELEGVLCPQAPLKNDTELVQSTKSGAVVLSKR